MTEFGGLRADAVEMGLASLHFAKERQVGGCWRSSGEVDWATMRAPDHDILEAFHPALRTQSGLAGSRLLRFRRCLSVDAFHGLQQSLGRRWRRVVDGSAMLDEKV